MPMTFMQVSALLHVRMAVEPVPQQGWPEPPHARHVDGALPPPPLHTKPPLQAAAAPPPDVPPAPLAAWQHGCPSPPHALVHIATPPSPPPPQPRPASHEDPPNPPPQHGSPAAPHFMQAFAPVVPVLTQPRPPEHGDWP